MWELTLDCPEVEISRFYPAHEIDFNDPWNGQSPAISGNYYINLEDVINPYSSFISDDNFIAIEFMRSFCLKAEDKSHQIFGEMLDCLRHRRTRRENPERLNRLQRLETPVTLPPRESILNLGHLLDHLADQAQIEIDIPPEIWDRKYVEPNFVPLTISSILRHYDVASSLQGDVLYTSETPESDWDVYPIPPNHLPFQKEQDFFELTSRLEQFVGEESWYAGDYTCTVYLNGCLIIRQSPEVHAKIAAWFAQPKEFD